MGAYDKTGNLLRTRNRRGDEEEEVEADGEKKSEEEIARQEEEAGLDEFERQQRKEQREAEAADEKENRRSKLPKERDADLRPFPLNQSFRSQQVLSDELREEVYRKVAEEGQNIQTVSAVYGIEMRRVAAVVRLKTVEKDWLKQVCLLYRRSHTLLLP